MYFEISLNSFCVIFKILRHTAGIVLLTLVINASTVEAVLKKLGKFNKKKVKVLRAKKNSLVATSGVKSCTKVKIFLLTKK